MRFSSLTKRCLVEMTVEELIILKEMCSISKMDMDRIGIGNYYKGTVLLIDDLSKILVKVRGY